MKDDGLCNVMRILVMLVMKEDGLLKCDTNSYSIDIDLLFE